MRVLTNAKIYTMNESMPIADTVAYEGKTITYVGNGWNGTGEVTDMKGKTILPGFIDSHIHPGACSGSAWHVRLPWTEDADELLEFVREYVREHPVEEKPFIYFEY